MDLKPISPTTTLTNALPKMYDNWQEYYNYWSHWHFATGQTHLSHTQWENGVVNQYEIDWDFVQIMVVKETTNFPFFGLELSRYPVYKWLKNFWCKVGLPAG